ncbi:MAG: sugar transporter ATP-binding protein [Modestobacter sp.]|nr:sugar transporter ATP-binding protein [Modestobacter sp.]MCW2616918.1 sugar transporter ATP-binding protein [Modestobacter sp.]
MTAVAPTAEPGADPAPAALLRVESLGKSFPGVRALDDVDLDVSAGEVHVLLGENGAGKSTLIKILAGVQKATTGRVLVDGRDVEFDTPRQAKALGISTIFQEFSLVPTLTVAENLFLGHLPGTRGLVARHRLPALAREALARVEADIPPGAVVATLPRSAQQLVEIAKGLLGEARLLILDEPTASLGNRESQHLIELVRALAGQGLGIIYITHRLQEIPKVADRVTVLRDGRRIATLPVREAAEGRLVELMTGRSVEDLYPTRQCTPGPARLTVDGLTGPELRDVSIAVHAGEIVGIAGLLGSGKSAVGRSCFGLDPMRTGHVTVSGTPFPRPSPSGALRRGLVYYPSDRRRQGLALNQSLTANITLGSLSAAGAVRWGALNRRQERRVADEYVGRLSVRPSDPGRRTELFSGGNQQKALLARGLIRDADVHVFDEPTVGIDIGAKADIYQLMADLAEAGKAVLLISSDLAEVLGMADRVYVMHEGQVVAHLIGEEITESAVLTHFFGTSETSTPLPGGASA